MSMLCNRCGFEGDPDYVHGHVQCKLCKQVIDDCCQGENVHHGVPHRKPEHKSDGTWTYQGPEYDPWKVPADKNISSDKKGD